MLISTSLILKQGTGGIVPEVGIFVFCILMLSEIQRGSLRSLLPAPQQWDLQSFTSRLYGHVSKMGWVQRLQTVFL